MESLLLTFFCLTALAGGVLVVTLRDPMRVALALVGVMLSLGGAYAALGVHVVAVFQVLIYVSAVMVFMVYTIMLLDVRDPSYLRRFSSWAAAGFAALALLLVGLGLPLLGMPRPTQAADFGVQSFSAAFLQQYWLHFELTSVLLVIAVVAALAVIQGSRRKDLHG